LSWWLYKLRSAFKNKEKGQYFKLRCIFIE